MSKNETLFKYREINKSSMELLLNRELWFAKPSSLNDPFECQEIAQDIFNSVWENYDIDEEEKTKLLGKLNRQLPQTGICSFSFAKKNQLMWSHYADEHKGICIGFNPEKLELNERMINKCKVIYQDDFPYKKIIERIKYFKSVPEQNTPKIIADDIISSIIGTKYMYWEYEREVRLVKFRHGAEAFHPSAVTSITFGLRTSARDKRTIRKILSGNEWSHIRWFQSEKSSSKFALEFEEI